MPLPADYAGSNRVNAKNNRMIPLSNLYHFSLVNPVAIDTDGILEATLGGDTTTLTPTLAGALTSGGKWVADYPRNVVITVTHGSSVVALSGVITGTDRENRPQTEAWSVTATGTSKTFTGKKAFKSVTSITIVSAADATTDTVIVGNGKVFGVPVKVTVPSAVKEIVAGSVVTTGTVVAFSTASTDDPTGTYTPSTAPDAANDYDAWLITDDPWNTA